MIENTSNQKKKYSENLKDPRWQKLRLKIFERDKWMCQICGANDLPLNVHHRYYKSDKEPWDYPIDSLVTLCEECHNYEKENRYQYEQDISFPQEILFR